MVVSDCEEDPLLDGLGSVGSQQKQKNLKEQKYINMSYQFIS